MAEQECKRIEKSDLDSLRSDPNMENWKETSRNKDIDGNRWKTRKGQVTEQIRRQRKGTEQMGIAKRHTERGWEQAGMSREGRRTMEKVLENTVHDRSKSWLATGFRFILKQFIHFGRNYLHLQHLSITRLTRSDKPCQVRDQVRPSKEHQEKLTLSWVALGSLELL